MKTASIFNDVVLSYVLIQCFEAPPTYTHTHHHENDALIWFGIFFFSFHFFFCVQVNIEINREREWKSCSIFGKSGWTMLFFSEKKNIYKIHFLCNLRLRISYSKLEKLLIFQFRMWLFFSSEEATAIRWSIQEDYILPFYIMFVQWLNPKTLRKFVLWSLICLYACIHPFGNDAQYLFFYFFFLNEK